MAPNHLVGSRCGRLLAGYDTKEMDAHFKKHSLQFVIAQERCYNEITFGTLGQSMLTQNITCGQQSCNEITWITLGY